MRRAGRLSAAPLPATRVPHTFTPVSRPLLPPPPLHPLPAVALPAAEVDKLPNGARLYVVDASPQPVVKLEVLIEAGRWQEHRASVAQACNALWREGVAGGVSGAEAAERIDFYGATLQGYSSLDHVGFTLYVLEKFVGQVLPVVFDLLLAPDFPPTEVETFVARATAQLRINADKPDVQGYRLLTEAIFGRTHPYGYNSTEAGLTSLTRADLQRHHARHFLGGNALAFLSGRVSPATRAAVRAQLERLPRGDSRPGVHALRPLDVPRVVHDMPHSLQSAVRLGRGFARRTHADFAGLYVLNTVLGGYFGSRLMTELREERGLTYNVYSAVDTMRYGGYLYLSAEVAAGNEAEALAAIRDELRLLREEPVAEDELEMVRAYLMGAYLSMVDGPFNTAETVRTLVAEGTPLALFDTLVETTRTITAGELQRLARVWLAEEDFYEVVVGPVGS